MSLSYELTRYALTLGAVDSTTGWFRKNYASSTIDGCVRPKGATLLIGGFGYYPKYEHTGFTIDGVVPGDKIVDAFETYVVKTSIQETYLDSHSHWVSDLQKLDDSAERPTTSGTWHLDSASAKTDSRYRHKLYLDTYLEDGNLLLDDGVTGASYITCFDGADYPTIKVFLDTDVDLIFSIAKSTMTPTENAYFYIYKWTETVNITLYAVDKTGLTATNLLDQAEEEIRHVVTDHPIGSIRRISRSGNHEMKQLGLTIHSCVVTIEYDRVNDEYTPSTPTFSYGVAFTYEGDRLSDGAEGDWTLTQGAGSTCTQAVTVYKNLYLNQTVFNADSYTINGTNLGLSTTTYPKIRWRYKTTGNATAKIIVTFSDATTQTVRSENASATFTVGSATLTASKTLDHITLYCCDGVGTVTYDFIQIYTADYILPNILTIEPVANLKDVVVPIPGQAGDNSQQCGGELLEVNMTCDLNMEPTTVKWKRPQATGASDYNNIDCLIETNHLQAVNQAWVWLDLGTPAMQFKARLLTVRPRYDSAGLVDLTFREYRHGPANDESTSERYGLSL